MNKLFSKIAVLYEDDHLLVIDKPSGLVVTPGTGYEEEDTLVGWLIARQGEGLRTVGSGGHRPGIVHRLDKDTSGVMVTVKTQDAFEAIVSQFKAKQVKKEYVALLWGDLKKTLENRVGKEIAQQKRFSVNVPLGRNPHNRMRIIALEDGRDAVTEFEIKDVAIVLNQPITTVLCYPKTGRTHQIRVHAKTFGHGIVGDILYQNKSEMRNFRALLNAGYKNRLYLHAKTLSFIHPFTKEQLTFDASVPPIFSQITAR